MRRKIIITGATSGIGKSTMEALANENNHLILGCRNIEKAKEMIDDVVSRNKDAKIDIHMLDLASFQSIENFAEKINKEYNSIDILVNNAGLFSDKKSYTKEGFESTVGVNYIGTYYLTKLLMDIVSKGNIPQIINICSRAALFGKFTLSNDAFVKQANGFRGYSASKYLQLISTIYLANNLSTQVKINAVHPGDSATGIWKGTSILMKLAAPIMKRFLSSPEEAAVAGLYLIDNPPQKSGMFFENQGEVITFDKYDEVFAKRLITETNKLIDASKG